MARMMKLSDIKIYDCYKAYTPRNYKINECRNYWNNHQEQDRYLVVNKDGYLIDGYIQYLILTENNIEYAKVAYSNVRKYALNRIKNKKHIEPAYRVQNTTYIYGIHPNLKSTKERIWRVPDSWKGWENDLLPGDKILVSTKNGIAPIIITNIKYLDTCPVDFPVKKVVRKVGEKYE